MTIEEKFYKAFGIEKISKCSICAVDCCYHCQYSEDYIYPDITAEKLLELICICSTVYPITINYKETVDELKEFILDFCIRHSKELGIKQICALFEE
jgi:hypothetical protein